MLLSLRRTVSLLLCSVLLVGVFAAAPLAADADAVPVRVVCTYYGDSKTSRGFSWATAAEVPSVVRVVLKESESEILGADAVAVLGKPTKFQGDWVHQLTVSGLAAGKEYAYVVGDGTNWSTVGHFKTDAGRGIETNFIVIADVQASSAEDFNKAAEVFAAAYERLPSPDFHVNLGDYVNDCTADEWNWYFDAFADLNNRATHAPVAGNHDGNLKWNWFKNMFQLKEQAGSVNLTGTYYSFDSGDAHFAVLNTNDMYPMSYQQRNWLINDMNATDAQFKIILMHRAAYSAGKNINKPDTLIMRNVLLPIIEDLGVDLVLTGHDHMYYRSYPVAGGAIAGDFDLTNTPDTQEGSVFPPASEASYTDPGAPIHIVPNTAGTKRYRVYAAMKPILDVGARIFQPDLPVYSTVKINDGVLEFNAYAYDAETKTDALFDTLKITKTTTNTPNTDDPLPTGFIETLPQLLLSLTYELVRVIVEDYILKLLPQALGL
ncbi:MAG: metallophosphoesterase family protein [Oscillospiraceae bacterium]|nr:metallophosphoesterase family protein [Oscillospiraceae bacterium]